MSPYLIKALVATEDERFYEHSGIDFRALGRAIVKRGLLGQTNAGGGSTITQQLAKQLYSEKASSTLERLLQKPIEWVIAIKLERYYTKQEILALYLNYFDFLHNAVGIKTAANTYFNNNRRILPHRGGYAHRSLQEPFALQPSALSGACPRQKKRGALADGEGGLSGSC